MTQAETVDCAQVSQLADKVRANRERDRRILRNAKANVLALIAEAASTGETFDMSLEMFKRYRTDPKVTMAALRDLLREKVVVLDEVRNYEIAKTGYVE